MTKKILYIYCEGKSDKSFFMALGRNQIIQRSYVIKSKNIIEINRIHKAIENCKNNKEISKSRLHNIPFEIVFCYDSDIYEKRTEPFPQIDNDKYKNIYFSNAKLEDFFFQIGFRSKKDIYRNEQKGHYKREVLERFEKLTLNEIEKLPTVKSFQNFPTIKDFILRLFKKEV